MNWKLSSLMLAGAALLASCSNEELQSENGTTDGLVAVTLTVGTDHAMATRATADTDDEPTRCYVQAFTTEDGGATTGDEVLEATAMTGDGSGTFTLDGVSLDPRDEYVFLFWADNGTGDAPADLTAASYETGCIAWASTATWNSSDGGTAVGATLTHVVSKVTLRTTTDLADGSSVAVTVPTTYAAYDVLDGTASTEVTDYTYAYTIPAAITGTTEGTEVFSFYVLTGGDTQELTVAHDGLSATVSNVPLTANTHVTLTGDVTRIGMTGVTLTATTSTEWGGTSTVDIDTGIPSTTTPSTTPSDPTEITGTGYYFITDDGDYVVSGTHGNLIIEVMDGSSPNIYLNNAAITSSEYAIYVRSNASATLHVVGTNILSAELAGIYVESGSSVTIEGSSRDDELTATGEVGIGSDRGCGDITIRNVTVRATSSGDSPGIGGVERSGTITIDDATVYAYGESDFPAIGAELLPIITISNSEIHAHRGSSFDYIDYIGATYGTFGIQATVTSSTVYCYTGSGDDVDKTVVYDADGTGTEQ